MRVLIAPDSFKGSRSATEVAAAVRTGWLRHRPDDEVVCLPLADGGEGTLDAVETAVDGAERRDCGPVLGPDMRPVTGHYLALPDGTALVELATVSGLPLLEQLRPLTASTRGLGTVLAAALDDGATQVMITLGGSATTDAATGALRQIGLRLTDDAGQPLADGGGALAQLAHLDASALRPPPAGGVTVLTDVDNPLLGPRGAAAIFGPQKGAGEEEIAQLEGGLRRLAELAGGDPDAEGAGAAGGAGYGFATFWDARIRPGSAAIAELAGLPDQLAAADLVITGEGTLDATSFGGKIPGYVTDQARRRGVAVAIVAGAITERPGHLDDLALVSTTELAGSTEASLGDPDRWLEAAGEALAREHDEGPGTSPGSREETA